MSHRSGSSGRAPGKVTVAKARKLVMALPGVDEGTSYGMPSFKVAGKFFARFRDDDTVLVVHVRSFEERDALLQHESDAFFTTDHYRNYPTVLVRLAQVTEHMLRDVLQDAWQRVAPKTAKRRNS